MFRYYDERAPEYEDAYVLATGTASMPDRDVFRREASMLTGIVERFARGRMVDLACGTGYWLPFYAARCTSITLIDQERRLFEHLKVRGETERELNARHYRACGSSPMACSSFT